MIDKSSNPCSDKAAAPYSASLRSGRIWRRIP